MDEKRDVTVIPAKLAQYTSKPISSTEKRLVAAYARVSTDHEEQQSSYEAQCDYYTNFIKNHEGWEFAGLYSDDGISATSTAHREGFLSMIDDALAGKIQLIVTKSISRFARNTVDSLTYIRELKDHGVECYFEKESIFTFDSRGELLISIMSSLAQEESRSISENTKWGHRKKFSDGRFSVPYSTFMGYDKGEDGSLVINEEQAAIVRRIFGMFLKGRSPHAIAKTLNAEGIPTVRGRTWCASTIRGMLKNEKYAGDALLQKYYTANYLTKEMRKNNGEVQQYFVRNDHPSIVSHEDFEQAQRMLAERRNGNLKRSGTNIFYGKVYCGDCGGVYGSKIWHSNDKYRRVVWQCDHKYDGGGKCRTPHLTEDQIRELFLKAVNSLLPEKDDHIGNIETAIDKAYGTKELEKRASELTEEMEIVSRMVQDGIERNAREALNQTEYLKQYDSLVERYEKAKVEHDDILKEIDSRKLRQASSKSFIKELKKRDGLLEGFSDELWETLADSMTVYAKDDIRIRFKDGSEKQVGL